MADNLGVPTHQVEISITVSGREPSLVCTCRRGAPGDLGASAHGSVSHITWTARCEEVSLLADLAQASDEDMSLWYAVRGVANAHQPSVFTARGLLLVCAVLRHPMRLPDVSDPGHPGGQNRLKQKCNKSYVFFDVDEQGDHSA